MTVLVNVLGNMLQSVTSEWMLKHYERTQAPKIIGKTWNNTLYVIMDEVYMLSVFEESLGYRSVLSLER